MSLWAMRLGALPCSVDSSCDPSPHVDEMRHWLQMGLTNASRRAAYMIELSSIWHRPMRFFIGETMRQDRAPRSEAKRSDAEHAVAVGIDSGQPYPAAIVRKLLDFAPKSLCYRNWLPSGHQNRTGLLWKSMGFVGSASGSSGACAFACRESASR